MNRRRIMSMACFSLILITQTKSSMSISERRNNFKGDSRNEIDRNRDKLAKIELSVKRQNYGNKWYLQPNKWNESMSKTKDKKRYELISSQQYVFVLLTAFNLRLHCVLQSRLLAVSVTVLSLLIDIVGSSWRRT